MSWWNYNADKTNQLCCFQYALSDRSNCGGCRKTIALAALRVKCEYGSRYYHFSCFWKYKTTAKCKKDEIMIAVRDTVSIQTEPYSFISPHYQKREHVRTFFDYPYVSLEVLDQNMAGMRPGLEPIIRPNDIERIRRQIALCQEGKTPYYTVTASKDSCYSCPWCYKSDNNQKYEEHDYSLNFDKALYHPKCLAESGIVNIDTKEIQYDDRPHHYGAKFDDTEKKFVMDKLLLDDMFKKDERTDTIFMAHTKLNLELCSSLACINVKVSDPACYNFSSHEHLPLEELCLSILMNRPVVYQQALESYRYIRERFIYHGQLRIRYKHLSYHPQCFAAMKKVNVDGNDIPNYNKMDDRNKMILDSYFFKSDDFDIPFFHQSLRGRGFESHSRHQCYDDYCNAAACCLSSTLSKFPYPYTIKKDQLFIRYKGEIYHPKCIQASGNINIDAKDMRNYENLTDETKRKLDEMFSSVAGTSAHKESEVSNSETSKRKIVSDVQNDIVDEPIRKKSKPKNIDDIATSEVDNSVGAKSRKKLKSKKNKSSCDEPNDDENCVLRDEEAENVGERPRHHKKTKNIILNEESEPSVDQESEINVEMEEENPTASVSIFAFGKPSTSKLLKTCTKLNVEFHNQVTRLWDTITFVQIDTVTISKNIKTQHFKTENFYEILSKYFTGKSKQHEKIKTTIIDALRENMVSSGEISSKKFEKVYLDTVTDEHLSFIAKFISCRILIFDGKEGIRKFGKWKRPESKRLTLVLSFVDGFYSIVLNF